MGLPSIVEALIKREDSFFKDPGVLPLASIDHVNIPIVALSFDGTKGGNESVLVK
jgi:hypothetical protein